MPGNIRARMMLIVIPRVEENSVDPAISGLGRIHEIVTVMLTQRLTEIGDAALPEEQRYRPIVIKRAPKTEEEEQYSVCQQ